ncbi:MAG: hypothetical protein DSM106950_43420 [Stigonema ocellatum SAG 48.90 = DSM 106950]|nr:hypothetical protein [Stigonema ocellatum SAG 48.90 = DSM 106950]
MNINILPQKQIKLACVFSILLLSFASYPSRVQAQLAESSTSTVANAGNLWEQKFPDNGAPTGRRGGGASRYDQRPDMKTRITAM